MRAGRFDKHVNINIPDVYERKEILDYYLSKVSVSDVESLTIARGITGFTGADIENLVNTAAIRASMLQRRDGISHAGKQQIIHPFFSYLVPIQILNSLKIRY